MLILSNSLIDKFIIINLAILIFYYYSIVKKKMQKIFYQWYAILDNYYSDFILICSCFLDYIMQYMLDEISVFRIGWFVFLYYLHIIFVCVKLKFT